MVGKRTGIDFSKHEVTIAENELVSIRHLAIPGTFHNNIKYTNVSGCLLVTGDYGNWVFCRPFAPDAEVSVSEPYWLEKLRNSSSQDPCEYNSDILSEAIKERISELEDIGYEGDKLKIIRGYYEECLDNVEDEISYISTARNIPSCLDFESIIISKDLKFWLKAVFDGFDEMCRRLKEVEIAERGVATAAQ